MVWIVQTVRDLGMTCKNSLVYIVGGVAVAVTSFVVFKRFLHRDVVYPRDTVILHQIGRGPYVPSLSSFVVKLETYLRMTRIPYQNVHDFKMSPKGKFPWIEYNGEVVSDTSICIDFLNKKLGIDLNKHLSPAEKAVAHSMKLAMEEHLFWCVTLFRWEHNKEDTLHRISKYSSVLVWMIRRTVRKAAWGQGFGRHSAEEIAVFMKQDLQALSDHIGSNDFLMGDDPCEADCSVFAMLSQLHWHSLPTDNKGLLTNEYPNLAAYCERMKNTFWPDWDSCITHGGTREATK